MKNKLVLLTLLSAFALVGCGGGGGASITPSTPASSSEQGPSAPAPSSEQGPSTPAPSSQAAPSSQGQPSSQAKPFNLKITFYIDYNQSDEPFYEAWWYIGQTFTKEDIGLPEPTDVVVDPYYPTFMGWSKYALVDEDERLFKFGVDLFAQEEVVNNKVTMYGIYVG